MTQRDATVRRAPFRRGLAAAGSCALLWWIVSAGDSGSWIVGVPVIVACGVWAATLVPSDGVRIAPVAVARFVPFFIWRSVVGGLDVARRAMDPRRLRISPDLVSYRMHLPAHGPARVVFVNVLSLLPGTLAADLSGDIVRLHTLNQPVDVAGLRRLEAHVARMLGHAERGP